MSEALHVPWRRPRQNVDTNVSVDGDKVSLENSTETVAEIGDEHGEIIEDVPPKKASSEGFDARKDYNRLIGTRSGGVYIPPARLRAIQAHFTDKKSKEYQRLSWETLKKSLNGLVNKVNKSNIKDIIMKLFEENLIRGRALLVRSLMKAQTASTSYTPVYAAMVSVINTKLPQIGELLLKRLIVQFRKSYRRNDKAVCLSSTTFIAQLCNFQVAHEIVALQILALLLEKPTEDSVEIAVGFMHQVGLYLSEVSSKATNGIFERFRTILHEGGVEKRVQYMIEVLFQIRKEKFKNYPIIPDGLDLVEEEDQITHYISLDDDIDVEESLGIFHYDEDYEANEKEYELIKREILGEESEEESNVEDGSDDEESSGQINSQEEVAKVDDNTGADLVNLRRNIYLTIMSSIDYEECCHKLLKLHIDRGQEGELCDMVVQCCSQERTYAKYYGMIGERFCKLNRSWRLIFEASFESYYDTIHRFETNKIRNIAKFFGHLLASDGIQWSVFSCVRLTEEETTSSSRIFLKILFEELSETLGIKTLCQRLQNPEYEVDFSGLFPKDMLRNTRFSINYFTAIGLGALTEPMRDYLNMVEQEEMRKFQEMQAAEVTKSSGEESSRQSSPARSLSQSPPRQRRGSYSPALSESEDEHRPRKVRHVA